jgi:hypothetical protein
MSDQKVAIDRDTLRTALVQSGVRMTAGTLSTLWEALGGEPAYISGRVYTDAGGVLWCRLAHPGNGSSLWRDCRTGLTFSESAPKRPLTLLGPVPSRDQVAKIIAGVNDYGNSYEVFEAGQAKLADRIMALLKGETP